MPAVLLAPLRALVLGHLLLVIYTGFIAIPALFLGIVAHRLTTNVLVANLSSDAWYAGSLSYLSGAAALVLFFPFLLVAVMLPIRTIWFENRLRVFSLIRDSVPTFMKAFTATLMSALGLCAIGLVLLLIYSGIYRLALFIGFTLEAPLIAKVVLAISALVALRIVVNLIAVPFVAAGMNLPAREALASFPYFIKSRRFSLGILIGIQAFLITAGIVLVLGGVFTPLSEAVLGFIAWYCLATICVFSLGSSEQVTTHHFQLLREAATPIRTEPVLHASILAQQVSESSAKVIPLRPNNTRTTQSMSASEVKALLSG